MNKLVAISLITIALIVGVLVGGWGVAAFFNRAAKRIIQHTSEVYIQSRIASADETIDALRYLRAGHITNAVDSLEMNLELNLIQLEPCTVNPSDLKSAPWNIEVLQKAKDYRAEFPYKYERNPDVARNVAEIFTVLTVQTNH